MDNTTKALFEEESRKRQRAEAQSEALAATLEEANRAHEAERRRISGNYYSTIQEVWKIAPHKFDDKTFFDQLKRNIAPHFLTRSSANGRRTQGLDVYNLTITAANATENEAAFSSSHASSTPENKQVIFPTDIFQNALFPDAHIAHLVPNSKNDASLYVDVAIWALGLDERAGWETWQKAIHGAKQQQNSNRAQHTGMKHFVANRIRLSGQYDYFDQKPCVFIIPAMSENEVRGWNGTGYNAIVMTAPGDSFDASAVCANIRMTNEGNLASPEEIENARRLLERVILGMAYWLKHISPKIEADLEEAQMDEKVRKILHDLRNDFTAITGNGVAVPRPQTGQDPSLLKVRIVTFSDHTSAVGHPAPDPLLLAAKAARNWSELNKQRLKAAAEPQVEDWEKDELYDLADEEFLEYRRNFWRPKTLEDLAHGLGQPSGYQQQAQEGGSTAESTPGAHVSVENKGRL